MEHIHETQPSGFLTENVALLPMGRILDIAMGGGRNAVYLAKLGFAVEGVDVSPEAVSAAVALAQKERVTIKAEVADLTGNYRIKENNYDVIICFNYLQRSLIPQIKAGLKKGGMVVYETFIIDQAELFGKPGNTDFLLKHNELLDMFRDFRCLRYREGVLGGYKAAAGIIAEKV